MHALLPPPGLGYWPPQWPRVPSSQPQSPYEQHRPGDGGFYSGSRNGLSRGGCACKAFGLCPYHVSIKHVIRPPLGMAALSVVCQGGRREREHGPMAVRPWVLSPAPRNTRSSLGPKDQSQTITCESFSPAASPPQASAPPRCYLVISSSPDLRSCWEPSKGG